MQKVRCKNEFSNLKQPFHTGRVTYSFIDKIIYDKNARHLPFFKASKLLIHVQCFRSV